MTTTDYWRITSRDYRRLLALLPELISSLLLYAIWKSQERIQYGCISIYKVALHQLSRVITYVPAPQGYYQFSRAVTSSPGLLSALPHTASDERLWTKATTNLMTLSLPSQIRIWCLQNKEVLIYHIRQYIRCLECREIPQLVVGDTLKHRHGSLAGFTTSASEKLLWTIALWGDPS